MAARGTRRGPLTPGGRTPLRLGETSRTLGRPAGKLGGRPAGLGERLRTLGRRSGRLGQPPLGLGRRRLKIGETSRRFGERPGALGETSRPAVRGGAGGLTTALLSFAPKG